MRPEHPRLTWATLVELVGLSAAEALAAWAGHRLPSRGAEFRAERVRRILAAIDAGESYTEIARRERVTRQRVAAIVRYAPQ